MSKQKTSSVIMSVLWVGRVKTLDAISMRRHDWNVFLLWVMREILWVNFRFLTSARDNTRAETNRYLHIYQGCLADCETSRSPRDRMMSSCTIHGRLVPYGERVQVSWLTKGGWRFTRTWFWNSLEPTACFGWYIRLWFYRTKMWCCSASLQEADTNQ